MTPDLILTDGRVICPAQNIDRVAQVSFTDGKVAEIADQIAPGPDTDIRDVSGRIVTPGLIDMHTHVYWGGTSLGIDAEEFCRTSGVTTAIDTGSAGPGNFPGFRKHVIDPCQVRILAYLHVSHAGIPYFSNNVMIGESEDIRKMDPRAAAEVADANRDVIVGIKIRLGRNASGQQGMSPFQYALQTAEEVGMPMMVHIDEPPPSYEEVIAAMRPGDVLTHCFRPFPNSPATAQGTVKQAVRDARARGFLFDVGHGKGSFSFKTARAMLANGFLPDTISSDVHTLCIEGPAYDQVTTLSKFLCMGVDLPTVIRLSTETAGLALQRPELGTLKPGAVGDATILELVDGDFTYEDVLGETMQGAQRIFARGTVVGGKWWHPA